MKYSIDANCFIRTVVEICEKQKYKKKTCEKKFKVYVFEERIYQLISALLYGMRYVFATCLTAW